MINFVNKVGTTTPSDFSEVGITNGLVGWWPLNGNANDITENRNNGTVTGATIASGMDGLCYSFNGISSYIYAGYGAMLNVTACSISYAVKMNTLQSGDHKIVAISEAFNTEVLNGIPLTYFSNGSAWYTFDHSVALTTGVWYYFSWTFNNGVAKFYKDGVLALEETFAISLSSYGGFAGRITMGARYNSTPTWLEFFDGSIQDVRIYNRALTAEEVKIQYELIKNKVMNIDSADKLYIAGKLNEVY